MQARRSFASDSARDSWRDACGAAVFFSFALIACDFAGLGLPSLELPYASGAAVVVLLGALLALGLSSRAPRVALAFVLAGLLVLRALAAVLPEFFLSNQGTLARSDAGALTLLAATVGWMLWVGASRSSRPRPA